MKPAFAMLLFVTLFGSCANGNSDVSVKADSLGRELDTLGAKIAKKTDVLEDSAKSKFQDFKASVKAGVDSIQEAHRDTTN